jgi:hypothetical protein
MRQESPERMKKSAYRGETIRRKDEERCRRLEVILRPENGLGPVVDGNLMKNVVQVGFDGVRADAQPVGDHLVGGAALQLAQQFDLATGQFMIDRFWQRSTDVALLQAFLENPSRNPEVTRIDGADAIAQVLEVVIGIEKPPNATFQRDLLDLIILLEIEQHHQVVAVGFPDRR